MVEKQSSAHTCSSAVLCGTVKQTLSAESQ